jgi:hypothetical protein
MFDPSRFEGEKGEVQPEVVAAPPTELELREREKELKARYEDPRRKVEAQEAWNKRKELQSRERERIEQLNALLQSAPKDEHEAPTADTKEDLTEEDSGKKLYEESKKRLLQKIRDINKTSREGIRNTFLSMESGELDIAKLAKESNAVVVHTIPLDGWHMGSTEMNNEEADTKKISAKEKADIISEKQPDLSASILSVETMAGQDMFYPFGYIVDGTLLAAYGQDEGTIASGDSRRRKEAFHGTLQKDTPGEFARVAQSEAVARASTQHNESIVHKPKLKGVILDEERLSKESAYYPGDEVREVFSSKEEEEKKMADYTARYGESIINSSQAIRTEMGIEPKNLFVTRKRSGIQKAVEYAQEHHPELPIYVRKADAIYTLDGKKVTAEDIYA